MPQKKISIFPIIQRVSEWMAADLEVDFKSHSANIYLGATQPDSGWAGL